MREVQNVALAGEVPIGMMSQVNNGVLVSGRLEIKAERIPDTAKRRNVERELALLQQLRQDRGLSGRRLDKLIGELKRTNAALWDIEDAIRKCERQSDFGPAFIKLARSVYKENDKRSELKREINTLFASAIVEEKYFPAE